MATSGSYNFTVTAGDVINATFRKLGIKSEGYDLSASEASDALQDLNLLLKTWPAKGFNLWRYEELAVFVDGVTGTYDIGATGDKASFNAFKTEIATAAISGASTITVDSDDNITNGDVIGIELDDGTLQWTTVNGVPAANVVTLTAVLTGAAAVDNHVYNYTSIAQRPLKLTNGRVKLENNNEVPLYSLTRQEYMALTTKENVGRPTQYYYNPLLDNGKLYTWPISDDVQQRLLFSAQRQLQDADALTDNLDMPQEWLLPLIFNLAVLVGFDYNSIDINSQQYGEIKAKAAELMEEVEDFDVESEIQFVPGDYQ